MNHDIHIAFTLNYTPPIQNSSWQFMVKPYDSENQKLSDFTFSNSKQLATSSSFNYFGFERLVLHNPNTTQEINFRIYFSIEVKPYTKPKNLRYEEIQERLNSALFMVKFEPFLSFSKLIPEPDFVDFSKTKTTFLFGLIKNISDYIRDNYNALPYVKIKYDLAGYIDSVTINKIHLFCAYARSYLLPSRMVSGYLVSAQKTTLHFWVEIYFLNDNWFAYDVIHQVPVDENYIKIAHGSDYGDCAILRLIHTATTQQPDQQQQMQQQ